MKQLNQLLIIEADPESEPLLSQFNYLTQSFSIAPAIVLSFTDLEQNKSLSPQLILLHSNLTTIGHLRRFIFLQAIFPYSNTIIISNRQDEELCLLAMEAGAEDSITKEHFSIRFMNKLVLKSLRRSNVEKELVQSRKQLLACFQNTPNVAVQWYNSEGEVLFWNHASERIFGWTAEEAIGKHLNQLVYSEDDSEFWLNKLRNADMTNPVVEPVEWSFRYRDGSEGCCISTFFPIPSFDTAPWYVCMDVEITQRKQTEKALKESEERYHTLFNQASDAIFINDATGRFLDMNERACQMAGFTKEQLQKKNITELYTGDELAHRPIMWKELLAGERTELERTLMRADGTLIPIEVTAQMLKDGRIMAIVRNIAERRRSEEALKQSEEKYRSLVEQQADAITIFSKEGKILDVNTSAVKLLNYTKDELRAMSLADVLSAEDLANNPVDFEALQGENTTIKQRKMKRKDGTLVDTEVHTKRLFDGLFLSSVRDLTERMQVQHQLKTERDLSDSIINSLPGLFYVFTQGRKYLRWNRQLELISGYSAGEISGMSPLDFFIGDDVQNIAHVIDTVFETGSSGTEAGLQTKDGKNIPYYFTGIATDYAGTRCLLGMGIDISAMKNLEKELSAQKIIEQKKLMQAMIDAEEKEKASLGLELHDNINQILSVVRMYLSILASDEVLEGVTITQTLHLVDTAINEIRNLSHSLAVGYQFEAGLVEALAELIEKIKLTKDFSIRFETAAALDEQTSKDQKLALYRMVQEQLNNIIKHAKASSVEVCIDITNLEILLTITDNGKGFHVAKTAKGLGLNNITNRAEALGGNVAIQSAPGEGCRVMVKLPLQPVTV